MADLLICRTCGVQFSTTSIEELNNQCPICLDPRQYVPPTGQSWTTLSQLRSENKHKNLFHAVDAPRTSEAQLLAIRTEPQLAIGQSAYLVRTPQGNVLWDCITYLDDETVEAIREYGGLQAIVISHPHFYSTHVEWAKAFDCPVYISVEDKEWLMRKDDSVQKCWSGKTQQILPDIKVVKVGGHFPGSCILHWNRSTVRQPSVILTADSIMPTPQGGISIMYSYPNLIGLHPDAMYGVWLAVKDLDFEWIYGGWYVVPVIKKGKEAILKSLKQIIKVISGEEKHAIFSEELPGSESSKVDPAECQTYIHKSLVYA